MEKRKTVKCKNYYWGFCRAVNKPEKEKGDYCKQDDCPNFKTSERIV